MYKRYNVKKPVDNQLAVLVDGDNVQPSAIPYILNEVVKYGTKTIQRIYGDWTTPQMEPWKKHLLTHAIQPIQQFRNIAGKNATDSAMIIDAMDILYTSNIDYFVLVSSDSDYTRLAIRIREAGKFVIGIGKQQTPNAFVKACNEFKYIENIVKSHEKNMNHQSYKDHHEKEINIDVEKENKKYLLSLLIEAYEMVDQESEWVDLRKIANNLKNIDPAFDYRTYGYSKLSKLFQDHPKIFDIKVDKSNKKLFVAMK